MKIKVHSIALALILMASFAGPSGSLFAAHSRHANGESGGTADISMFYDALKPYGTWYNTAQYGDVWHPAVSDQKPDWRPYTAGNWAQTDQGWTWVSDEPFGWAVYHYGRWTRLKNTGWVWVPDSEWATAWVAWRSSPNLQMAEITAPEQLSYHDADSPSPTPSDSSASGNPAGTPAPANTPAQAPSYTPAPSPSDDSSAPPSNAPPAPGGNTVSENFVGWAPLPPDAELPPDGDIGPSVDASCDIDPGDYCFVDAAYIGDPDLSLVVFPASRNDFYVSHTVNVTNVSYYGAGARSVYAGGPDFAKVSAISREPVRTLALSRETSSRAVASSLRANHGSVVHGNTLQVASPHFKSRPADGILGGDRQSLQKVDSTKAAPATAGDPAAASRAHDAMASQAHSTVSPAQSSKAIEASQAEYRSVSHLPASASGDERTRAAEEGAGRTRSEPGESGEKTGESRSGSESGRRHTSEGERTSEAGRSASRSARSARTKQPESFMDKLRSGISKVDDTLAPKGAAGKAGAAGKKGAITRSAPVETKKK